MRIDGRMIQNRRKKIGLTQKQLAVQSLCTQPVICQIEKENYNHSISITVIKNICRVLMLDIDKVVQSKKYIKLHHFENITMEDLFIFDYDAESLLNEVEPLLESQQMKIRYNYIAGINNFLNDNTLDAINYLQPALYFFDNKYEFERLVIIALLSFSYFSVNKYVLSTEYLNIFMHMTKTVDNSYLHRTVMYNIYAGLIYICYENKLLDYAKHLHELCYQISQKYIRMNYVKKLANKSENKKIVDALDKLHQPVDKKPDYELF